MGKPRHVAISSRLWPGILVGWALVTSALTFLGLLAITFVIGRVVPIDPVLAVVGDRASRETYEAARLAMGLDDPLVVQFARYVGAVLQGDLGMSVSTGRPVPDDLARVFPGDAGDGHHRHCSSAW
jgi:peptide/nickel transport system permease protein